MSDDPEVSAEIIHQTLFPPDEELIAEPGIFPPLEPATMVDSEEPGEPGISDTEAIGDLSRPARAVEFRTQRRSQVSTVIPALLMIALGVLYISLSGDPQLSQPLVMAGLAVGVLGLGLLVRFFMNGREEPGLLFFGLLVLLLGGLAAAGPLQIIDFAQGWPLAISAVGAAILLTFLFGRSHDRALLLPGGLFVIAGLSLLLFTADILPIDLLPLVAAFWPVLFIIMAVILLPRTIRRRS